MASNASTSNEVTVKSLQEFVAEIEQLRKDLEKTKQGKLTEVIYRGQCGNWEVESSAYRRLYSDVSEPSAEDLVKYQEDLIHKARQYDIEIKNDMQDISVLSELQHHGAATSLLDFTKSALTALWFACQQGKENNEKEVVGKVFCLDVSDITKTFLQLKGEEQERKPIREVLGLKFQERNSDDSSEHATHDLNKNVAIWEPAMLNNRIIKQDSLFIFNKTGKLDTTMFQKILVIPSKHKEEILKSLKNTVAFSEESLFPDFYGFAQNNSYDVPYGPQTADEYIAYGRESHRQGKMQEAEKYFGKAIKLEPQSSFAYARKGDAKRGRGQYQEAIADYNEAIEINPQNGFVYASRGDVKRLLKQYKEAIADYDKAIELDPLSSFAYARKGDIRRLLEQYKEAIADYDEAIKLNPQNDFTYTARGTAKRKLGKYQEAIADFDEAIRLNPQNSYAYAARGDAKRALEQYEEAIADYDKAIELEPQSSFAYARKGDAKRGRGQYQEAIADYNEAIEINPQNGFVYASRGDVKRLLKQYKEAIADYDKAIELDPLSSFAYARKGDIRRLLEQYKEAIADYDEAIKLNPQNAFARSGKEKAEKALGQKP